MAQRADHEQAMTDLPQTLEDPSTGSDEIDSRAKPNPYFLLAMASLFWSGNHIVGRAIAGEVPPFAISMLRWLLPAIFIGPFARFYISRDWPLIKRDWKILLFLGMTGGAIFTAGQYVGLQYTSALNVSVLNSITPVLIVTTSAIIFRDRLTLMQAFGIATSLTGVLIIVTRAEFVTLAHLTFNRGDIIIVLNMALMSVYSSLLRLMPPIHWLSFIMVLAIVSTGCLLPFFVWEHVSNMTLQPTWLTLFAILYVSIFPSFVSYAAWTRGIEIIGANRAGPFLHLIPLYSAVLASFFLGEKLMTYHIYGFALILAGVWCASYRASDARDRE